MRSQRWTKVMNESFRVSVLVLAVALSGEQLVDAEGAGDLFTVVPSESRIVYHVVHKLHRVDGTSRKAEGRARILPTGQAQVSIRVPIESFDSGNSNRDSHMKEAVEAARFPVVELKASCDGMSMPISFPATNQKICRAQISFHGIQKVIDVSVQAAFESATRIHATSTFALSLDEFKVARPSLMFVKIDDELKMDVDLMFSR